MITTIFDLMGDAIVGAISLVTSAFTGVTNLFYDPLANAGAGSITTLGSFLVFGAATGLVFFAMRWLIAVIKQSLNRKG